LLIVRGGGVRQIVDGDFGRVVGVFHAMLADANVRTNSQTLQRQLGLRRPFAQRLRQQ